MKVGKLHHEDLARLLSKIELDESVILGPAVGEDAAAVRLGDKALILTTDPITFATDLIGYYVVHVSANDVAAMGAEPRWFMLTLILDTSGTAAQVRKIFAQVRQACKDVGVVLVGGHTETTTGLDRPIAVGSMIGLADPNAVVRTGGARPGDAIVLAGYAAVEGTALLALEAPEVLAKKGVAERTIAEARGFLFDPGISAVKAARIAVQAGKPTAMHDPTEGGIATGLLELAIASGTGMEAHLDKIRTLPETDEITRAVEIDPLGLISSGSLLITSSPKDAGSIAAALEKAGIAVAIIGGIRPQEDGLVMVNRSGPTALPKFERDEIARFFENLKRSVR
jgi:hydrogenase maturation factor